MDLLVFPTTPDDVPSSARLLSAAWLSALPYVCALVGCGPGDARAGGGGGRGCADGGGWDAQAQVFGHVLRETKAAGGHARLAAAV